MPHQRVGERAALASLLHYFMKCWLCGFQVQPTVSDTNAFGEGGRKRRVEGRFRCDGREVRAAFKRTHADMNVLAMVEAEDSATV